MVWLIELLGWRPALLRPALLATAVMAVLTAMSRGAVKPVMSGNSIAALRKVFGSPRNLLLFGASSVVYGAYYVLPVVMGQECLIDSGMSKVNAERLIMFQVLLIAICNLGTSTILRVFGGYRKLLLLFVGVCGLAGAVLGAVAFGVRLPLAAVVTAFVLMAVPAGFFSLQSLIAKELNPPELAGFSISMLNFCAFILIMSCQPVAGVILDRHGDCHFAAYRDIFIVCAALELIGIACALFVPETRPKRSGDA